MTPRDPATTGDPSPPAPPGGGPRSWRLAIADRAPRRARRIVAAAGIVVAVVAIVALRPWRAPSPHGGAEEPVRLFVTLEAPRGDVGGAPEALVWRPVEGAARYRVRVGDADTVWPLLLRTVAAPPLALTAADRAALRPGRIHEWEVEALAADGAALATGAVRFRIVAGMPPP